MKTYLLLFFLALNAYGAENSQNCYCPTCPDNIKKCSNTGDSYTRKPSNDKNIVQKKSTKRKQAKVKSQ